MQRIQPKHTRNRGNRTTATHMTTYCLKRSVRLQFDSCWFWNYAVEPFCIDVVIWKRPKHALQALWEKERKLWLQSSDLGELWLYCYQPFCWCMYHLNKNNATVFEMLVVKERANKAVNWHLELYQTFSFCLILWGRIYEVAHWVLILTWHFVVVVTLLIVYACCAIFSFSQVDILGSRP